MKTPQVQSPKPLNVADLLVGAFKSTSDTFTLPVKDHEGNLIVELTLKRIKTFAELDQYEKQAAVKIGEWTKKDGHHEAWKPFLPISQTEAAAAFVLHYFGAGDTAFTHLDAIRVVKSANAWIVKHIIDEVNKNQIEGINDRSAEAIVSEKNDSRAIGGTELGSPSPETSLESTTGD